MYYGIFRKKIFDEGLRLNEDGEFGKPGYGWEDHDMFQRMKARGIVQYAAHINKYKGKYFHAINSSIRNMGRGKYIETSKARHEEYRKVWND